MMKETLTFKNTRWSSFRIFQLLILVSLIHVRMQVLTYIILGLNRHVYSSFDGDVYLVVA